MLSDLGLGSMYRKYSRGFGGGFGQKTTFGGLGAKSWLRGLCMDRTPMVFSGDFPQIFYFVLRLLSVSQVRIL